MLNSLRMKPVEFLGDSLEALQPYMLARVGAHVKA